MSLKVWLPLNGSLKNQGLDNVEVINNEIVFNDNGKIGKCCSFTNGYLNLSPTFMTDFTECSVCFWIKINSWNTSYETYFQAGKNFYSWSDYILGILRNGSNSTVCFTIGNGTSYSGSSYLTSTWNVGEWMHVAFVYSSGKCKIYLNGNLDKEYNTTIIPDFTKITKITIGHSNGSGYQTNCLMNDFRIYDHALSHKEIHKISQGLIVHYPFNKNGLDEEDNLSNDIMYDISGYQNNGIIHGTFSYNTNTPLYKLSTNAQGGSSTYLEGIILPDEAKTVSLWIKCAKNVSSAIFNDKTTGLQIGLLNSLLYVNSKSSTAGFTTSHWKNNEWNHVVAINDNGVRKCYVNGQPETQSGSSNYYIHNADKFWVWNRSYNNSYPYKGSLSDLRIYTTALSEEEIKELYKHHN